MKGILLFCTLMLAWSGVSAQPDISLSDADYQRLGIRFMVAGQTGTVAGEVFPATVVASPERSGGVFARHAGQLDAWLAQPGEAVAAGDRIALMHSESMLTLQSEWLDARAALEQARFELDKDTTLLEAGAIAERRVVNTRRDHRVAAQAEQSLSEKLRLAGLSEADLMRLRNGEGLGRYPLRAPYAGVLVKRLVSAGTFIAADTRVASFSDGQRWISSDLPARVAASLESGQTMRLGNGSLDVTIRMKDRAIDPHSQTVRILAQVQDDNALQIGQVVSLVVPPPGEGTLIPASAVVRLDDRRTIYVRDGEGVSARTVSIVPAGQAYLVKDGLSDGEALVVQGAAILKGIQLGLGGE